MTDHPGSKDTVLFLCTHNSARSQMAEGLLRDRYGDRYEACSAGVEATEVRPLAIEVTREVGIDLSDHTSKTIDDPSAATGAEDERRAVFRRVRDALADWIDETFGEEPVRSP